MNKPLIYSLEELRLYDILWGYKEILAAISDAAQSFVGGNLTLISGFEVTPDGMDLDLLEGRMFVWTVTDEIAYSSLAIDNTPVFQVGVTAAQTLTLSTAGLSLDQGMYALVQVKFEQIDDVRADDPTGGVLPYYNPSDPSQPLSGPSNSGVIQDTVRRAVATVSVKYGAPNTIGAEVPPTPDVGCVPMYLISLIYGQTVIDTVDIVIASPNLGGGVPVDYPQAPFLAGLVKQHHTGVTGQAPKIVLTGGLEVQGILPYDNLPSDLVGKASADANKVFAGPATGSPDLPAFRRLVAADLPTPDPEAANTVYAGPVNGADATPVFRKLVAADIPPLGSFLYQQFASTGTWVCPTGTTLIWLTIVGGGGGGAGGGLTSAGSGGGAGAGIRFFPVVVVPGVTYTVTIGTGGAGGALSNGAGGNGVASSFIGGDVSISVPGGTGGTGAAGGAGGAAPYLFPNGGTGSNRNSGQGGAGGTSIMATGVVDSDGGYGAGGAGGDANHVGYLGGGGYALVIW